MKRITPEMVQAAYATTGLEPVRGYSGDGETCACPLAALAEASYAEDDWDVWAWDEFGKAYMNGFISAIDGRRKGLCGDVHRFNAGYADGRAVAEAIWGEG